MKAIITSACALMLMASVPAHAQLFGLFGKSPAQKMKDAGDTSAREFDECMAKVFQEPAVAPIAAKMPKSMQAASLLQQTDESKATDEEVAALSIFFEKRQVCRSRAVEQTRAYAPTVAAILAEQFANTDKQLIGLVQKKISWGDFVLGSRDLGLQSQKLIAEEGVKIEAGLQRQQEAERARWNQALQQSLQYDQNQRMIDAVGSNSFGSSTGTVNCRTVAIGGGMVRTQCY